MADHVIGNKGCEINSVVLTIELSIPPPTRRKIETLMRRLETDSLLQIEINRQLKSDPLSIYDAIGKILNEWRSRQSDNATLSLLVLQLRACHLVSHADALEKKFMTNKPAVERFEMPVSENTLQRNTTNRRANTITYQCDKKSNEKSAQVSSSSYTTQLSMQTKHKVKTILGFVICITLFVFLSGLCLYLGIPAAKNAYEQNTPKLIAEKVTTPKHLQEQQDEVTYETPPIRANTDKWNDINLPSQEESTTCSLNLLELKPIRLSMKSHSWTGRYDPVRADSWMKIVYGTKTDDWKEIDAWIETDDGTLTNAWIETDGWMVQNTDFDRFKIERVVNRTLDGCTSYYYLEVMLEKFYMVKNLTIINEGGIPCEIMNHSLNKIEGEISKSKYKMPLRNLMNINVVNITNDKEVFTVLANSFIIPNVVELRINSLILHEENVFWLRELLSEIRFSLEILDLSNVSWETSLFNNMKFKFMKLYELRIDFLCFKTSECNILGDLPFFLPALKNLISEKGYLTVSQNNVISKIKEAEYLKYCLAVSKEDSMPNISVLTANLLNLKIIHLFVIFEDLNNCKRVSKNSLVSDKLIMETNCLIRW